ncbi:MAG: shikimate kinase [Pseudomonadota bacterium]
MKKELEDAAELPFMLKKTIAMVGMMGAGKTAIGTALAKRLGVPFLDSDAEISKAANMTIAEIFERDGEPFFRDRESEVISRLLNGPPCILSTGGGAFLREDNRKMIAERGAALWLRAELELLWQRVKHKTTRPLLRTSNPRATLAAIQAERDPLYAQADIVVDADFEFSIEDMTERVLKVLAERPDVLEGGNDP